MSADCIFCRIAAGEIPSVKLAETERALAFMDIGPIVKGHALVIPRAHYDPLTAVPDDVLGEMIALAKRIAAAQVAGLDADGFNLHQANGACAGQAVPHAHIHVIPRFEGDGHSWNWRAGSYEEGEMERVADSIRRKL
jgi:histidine triad (HIT) family protein